MNKRIELLAPAGNLEKAKIALIYGADAVYVGGKSFSLRARASNFEIDDIKELCTFAHSLNKRVYVTTNIIPHDDDLKNLDEYLLALKDAKVDAIITSSLAIMLRAKELVPSIERHVSTQMSISNHEIIKFYEKIGCTRVVLAREVNLEQMAKIKKASNLELEVFIHGGMCSSYSGRCVLSNHLTNRDANRGGCAHSCRWNYRLFDGKHRVENKKYFFNMGSKDLMAVKYIPNFIDLGISSLKIEGRMKSAYYLATVVGCYRKVIDLYLNKGKLTEEEIKAFETEISKAENRLTSTGFLNKDVTINEQLYDTTAEHPTKEYIGYVLDYDENNRIAKIEQLLNNGDMLLITPDFTGLRRVQGVYVSDKEIDDVVEFFGPNLENTKMKIEKIIDDETGEEIAVARHPLQILRIEVPFKLSKDDMMRKVK